ncbi:MAG TPA: DUF6600 domain-containing protein [Thermoanaerobaculia bacterium]|jgi:hypothetical protein
MRRATLTLILFTILATPLYAVDKHQSYFSYDDGGTVLRQGDDSREVEVRVNMPLYPGDEVITNRRGRSEVRLSDGNVVGIDRATAVRFRSILDSFEGEASETVAELSHGKLIIYRTDRGGDYVRVDTGKASYVATKQAIYSIETDSRGQDRVSVFEGSIEVRTPSRTTRLRDGEMAAVDDRGLYDVVSDNLDSADDFERWFLKRADRYDKRGSRYLDDRFAYYDDELDAHGRWVNVTGIGWSWRPYVAVGWRPYYNGYWGHSRWGSLTWISYEPWGWMPYHYGRWAYDSGYGWVWVPGYGYSPAWVYWMYGPGYVGWAPAGYWDCYRPYYNWAYSPRHRADFGWGFYGRVRTDDFDLRPWTFIDSNTIISTRVDRAALTTDAVRARLGRTNGGLATISSSPARFTREEFKDPAAAIQRRGIGSGTGDRGVGSPADVTPFIRRDPDLSGNIRERIARVQPPDSQTPVSGRPGAAPMDGVTGRIGRTIEGTGRPVDDGTRATDGRLGRGSGTGTGDAQRPGVVGGDAPSTSRPAEGNAGRVNRGNDDRDSSGAWRDRIGRPATTPSEGAVSTPAAPPSSDAKPARGDDSWRGRAVRGGDDDKASGSSTRERATGSDAPRRVINGIGGARVTPGDGGSSSRGSSGSSDRPRVRGGDSGGSSSRGSRGSDAPRVAPPPARSSDGGSARSSGSSGSSSSGSSSRGNGGGSSSKGEGRVQRGNE